MAASQSPEQIPPAQDEVHLPALRQALAKLNRKVSEAQAKVIASTESHKLEFSDAFDQIGELRGTVARLQADLHRASNPLGGAPNADGSPAVSPEPSAEAVALEAAVREHAARRSELQALEAAAAVLETLLKAQHATVEMEELTRSARFCDAAARGNSVAKALLSISAPDASREPPLVQRAKAAYYQRRAVLASRLEEALGHLCSFQEGQATARSSAAGTSLNQVWGAFQSLGLRDRRAEQFAEQARHAVLRPILERARKLPQGSSLQPHTNSPEGGTTVWSCTQVEPAKLEMPAVPGGERPAVQAVLPVLESLLAFAYLHWAGSTPEVYAILGKRLWPPIARCLLQHFETGDDQSAEALVKFEGAMQAKGLIAGREQTLSRHAQERRHVALEQRRASVLAEAREWLLQEDSRLKKVSDAEESWCVTRLLRLSQRKARPGAGASPAASQGAPFGEKLLQALKDDSSLLRLPTMHISAPVHQLVGRLRSLMDEAVAAAEQGRVAAAQDLNRLIRELCTLFALLRPAAQSTVQLRTNPQCFAVFFADCLYLTHALLMMPYACGYKLPGHLRHLTLFVDLVPQIRRLGEGHFQAMMRSQQERIVTALKPCDFAPGMGWDRSFQAARAALDSAVQQAASAVEGLSTALPTQVLHEVAGLLLGIICRDLLGKLLRRQRMDNEEVSNASALLLQASLMMPRQILPADCKPGPEALAPGWPAFALTAELLGASLSRFLERRTELLEALTEEELLNLLHLSLTDPDAISPQDAWEAIRAG